jgi:hypothetical protein
MKKYFLLLTGYALFSTGIVFGQPTQPANPAAGNASNCTVVGTGNVQLDACPANSTIFVSNFQGGVYNRGNNGNHLGTGAVWRFANIGTVSGITINAEVTVNGSSNATLQNMDDNSATDQAGNSVADFFGPVIAPDVNLNNSDRRGYVEFTISFYQGVNNYAASITMNGLNFVSYDADGSYNTNGTPSQTWLRETRVAQLYSPGNPTILANNSSELTAYNYTDPIATSWTGFAGSVYERTGISRCAQVASSFKYGSGAAGRSSITFRFGYDFKAGSGYNVGNPGRQYGARFGCYNFPSQTTLPLKLLSFNGAYRNQHTTLSWSTENEQNVDRFQIERSSDGVTYSVIATQGAKGGVSKTEYALTDDLAAASGNTFFYRLKVIDIDSRFNYSQVVLIRKDRNSINGISVSPNPAISGNTVTARFEATISTAVDFKVLDLTGRIVLSQQNKVYEGANSVVINNLNRLQPGTYILQMKSGNTTEMAKFTIAR